MSQKVTVTASSPPSRYTDPKALVSMAYQVTYRHTQGNPSKLNLLLLSCILEFHRPPRSLDLGLKAGRVPHGGG